MSQPPIPMSDKLAARWRELVEGRHAPKTVAGSVVKWAELAAKTRDPLADPRPGEWYLSLAALDALHALRHPSRNGTMSPLGIAYLLVGFELAMPWLDPEQWEECQRRDQYRGDM